jgi:hypothetical protein
MGGLGNQLFQIITTLAYCIQYKRDFIFPYSEKLTVGIVRPTYWDTIFARISNKTTRNHPNPLQINSEILTKFQRVNEKRYYDYFPLPEPTANTLLVGYFQNRKYIDTAFDEIADFLDIPSQRAKVYEKYQCLFDGEYTVSMHFRIGDYATKQEYHPILTENYYMKTLKHILSARDRLESGGRGTTSPEGGTSVFYFCEKESNPAAQEIIKKLTEIYPKITFFKVDDNIPDWEQMYVMSLCNDHIIANSTFSWWGARLNPNPEKIVCYPREWLGWKMRDYSVDGLIYPDWVGFSTNME